MDSVWKSSAESAEGRGGVLTAFRGVASDKPHQASRKGLEARRHQGSQTTPFPAPTLLSAEVKLEKIDGPGRQVRAEVLNWKYCD